MKNIHYTDVMTSLTQLLYDIFCNKTNISQYFVYRTCSFSYYSLFWTFAEWLLLCEETTIAFFFFNIKSKPILEIA